MASRTGRTPSSWATPRGVGSFASRSSPMAAPVPSQCPGGRSAPPGRGWDRVRRPRERLGCGHRAEHHRSGVAHRRSDDHRNRCRRSRLGLEHRVRQERRPVGGQLRDRPDPAVRGRLSCGSMSGRKDSRSRSRTFGTPGSHVGSAISTLRPRRTGDLCQNMPAATGLLRRDDYSTRESGSPIVGGAAAPSRGAAPIGALPRYVDAQRGQILRGRLGPVSCAGSSRLRAVSSRRSGSAPRFGARADGP